MLQINKAFQPVGKIFGKQQAKWNRPKSVKDVKNIKKNWFFFVYARWLTCLWSFVSFHCQWFLFSQSLHSHFVSTQIWRYILFNSSFCTWIMSDTPSQDTFCKFLACRLDWTSCLLHLLLHDETKQNCDMGCFETLPLPIRAFINRQAWNVILGLIPLAGPSRFSALFAFSPFFRIFEWLPLPVPLKLKLAPTCRGTFTLLCA